MNLQEKIENKKNQIAKLEKKVAALEKETDKEFVILCDKFFSGQDKSSIYNYRKEKQLMFLPEYYQKRSELECTKETLAKYIKQLESEKAREETLKELPDVIIKFKNNIVDVWDRYDNWKLQEIKKIYRDDSIDYKTRRDELVKRFGKNWYEFKSYLPETIHQNNVKDADTLILNMINRVSEKAGKIIDCAGLRLDRDNQGYTTINGLIIGEKRAVSIESIGAGGYNIQRYHIRVLVK